MEKARDGSWLAGRTNHLPSRGLSFAVRPRFLSRRRDRRSLERRKRVEGARRPGGRAEALPLSVSLRTESFARVRSAFSLLTGWLDPWPAGQGESTSLYKSPLSPTF